MDNLAVKKVICSYLLKSKDKVFENNFLIIRKQPLPIRIEYLTKLYNFCIETGISICTDITFEMRLANINVYSSLIE